MRECPTFFVVGAAKSGTTALYFFLRQHQEISVSPVKEPCYWAYGEWRPGYRGPGDTPLLGVTDRESYQTLYAGVTDHKTVGEASIIDLHSGPVALGASEPTHVSGPAVRA